MFGSSLSESIEREYADLSLLLLISGDDLGAVIGSLVVVVSGTLVGRTDPLTLKNQSVTRSQYE